MKYVVDELEGALLDCAVAACGEWETAHEFFPTMTLDPTFSGFKLINGKCILQSRNPMRQGPQEYEPSALWEITGPIIQREKINLSSPGAHVHRNGGPNAGWGESGIWTACTWSNGHGDRRAFAYHETSPLIAAMRCYIKFKFGNEIEMDLKP